MLNVILCSKSAIKNLAVKKWLKFRFKFDFTKITTLAVPSAEGIVPEQPIGIGGVTCCHERIKLIETHFMEEILKNRFVISIENSINIEGDKLSDIVNVVIKDIKNNKVYAKSGNPINIDLSILDKYPKFMNIIGEFRESYEQTSQNYVFNGCEKTLGSLINKYYPDIPKDNWMKKIFDVDRVDQIFIILKQIGDMMNNDELNNIKNDINVISTSENINDDELI